MNKDAESTKERSQKDIKKDIKLLTYLKEIAERIRGQMEVPTLVKKSRYYEFQLIKDLEKARKEIASDPNQDIDSLKKELQEKLKDGIGKMENTLKKPTTAANTNLNVPVKDEAKPV